MREIFLKKSIKKRFTHQAQLQQQHQHKQHGFCRRVPVAVAEPGAPFEFGDVVKLVELDPLKRQLVVAALFSPTLSVTPQDI